MASNAGGIAEAPEAQSAGFQITEIEVVFPVHAFFAGIAELHRAARRKVIISHSATA